MPIEFRERTKTDRIYVFIRRNQPDIGLFEITQKQKRLNYLDSGLHFNIRQDGTVERGRPHSVVGSFFPNCIDISVICKEDAPTDTQTAVIDALLSQLQQLYQGVTIHYV